MNLDKAVQKLGYKDYKHYLRSSHWLQTRERLFRSKLIKRDIISGLPKCEACERMDLPFHVHHRSYKKLGKEPLMHLSLLCELCHAEVHEFFKANAKISLWAATKIIIKAYKKQLKKQDSNIIYIEDKILNNRVKIAPINFGTKSSLVKK